MNGQRQWELDVLVVQLHTNFLASFFDKDQICLSTPICILMDFPAPDRDDHELAKARPSKSCRILLNLAEF